MKKIFLFTAIVMSLIAQSCSKSTDVLITTGFNIEEAKMSFANNFNNALSTKSSNEAYYSLAGGDYTPVWEMAKANENEFIWSLEVPIISDLQIVLRNKTTEVIKAAERKLLFIKNKETHSVHSFIMVSSTAETKSSNSNFEHLAENASYSGYVLYSTLAGEFVNLCSYENGVETANINVLNKESKHNHECDSTCIAHKYDITIDEVMGSNEFGIMPLGMGGGEYFEGVCIWCGAPEPECWCDLYDDEPVLCLQCGGDYLKCGCDKTVCEKCGRWMQMCECDLTNDSYFCNECGNYHSNGECKYICTKCGKHMSTCVCK